MGYGPLGQVGKGDGDRQGEEEGRHGELQGNTVICFRTKRTFILVMDTLDQGAWQRSRDGMVPSF